MKDDEPVKYIERQKAMDAQYRKAFEDLTPEQRVAMERGGVKGVADMTGLLGLGGSKLAVEKDAAKIAENSIAASVSVDMAAKVDTVPDLLRGNSGFPLSGRTRFTPGTRLVFTRRLNSSVPACFFG